MKAEEGLRLALEAKQIEEEEEHTRIEAEYEARLVEEERLKSEEENLWLKAEEEHHTWLKVKSDKLLLKKQGCNRRRRNYG